MEFTVLNRITAAALFLFGLLSLAGESALAANQVISGPISAVSVNGGADTANPGTTCVSISNLIAACKGWAAIPNNNSLLTSAALAAKSAGSNVWFYYTEGNTTNTYHCPGLVFTPCGVISIMLQ